MKNITLLLFILLIIYPIFGQTNSPISDNDPKSYAIIIGVSEYSNLEPIKNLEYADDDATMISNYLDDQGFSDIYFYTDKNATNKDSIGKLITEILLHKAKQGDRVIIYFAGHGVIDDIENQGFLLLNKVCSPKNGDYASSDALRIESILKRIIIADEKGVEVLLIIDACHSGYAERAMSSNTTLTNNNDPLDHNSVLMLSSKASQESKESPIFKHGYFTYFLVKGLQGLADSDENKTITFNEIRDYVSKNVLELSEHKQSPIFRGRDFFEISTVIESNKENLVENENVKNDEFASNISRGLLDDEISNNSKAQSLFTLFQTQIKEGIFFKDEIVEINDEKIKIGKTNVINISSHSPTSISTSKNKFAFNANGIIYIKDKFEIADSIAIKIQNEKISLVDFFSNDKILTACTSNGFINVWKTSDGTNLTPGINVGQNITVIKAISNECVAIGTEKGFLIIWDWKTNKISRFKLHKKSISDFEILNNKIYSSGLDGRIIVFDLLKNIKINKIKTDSEAILSLEIIPEDNRLITSDSDKKIKLLDLNNLKVLKEIQLKSTINCLEKDPFNMYCFVGTNQKDVLIIDLFSFKLLSTTISTKIGVKEINYDFDSKKMFLILKNNTCNEIETRVNSAYNCALDTRDYLLNSKEYKNQKFAIEGALAIGLNSFVTTILSSLINDYVSVEHDLISKAKRYASKSYEIGKNYVLDENSLEINVLLLDIFEILQQKKETGYLDAIQKIKRVQELDSNNSYSFNLAADLFLKTNNIINARLMIDNSLKNAPSWLKPQITNSLIKVQEGDLAGAELGLKNVIRTNPEIALAHLYLGEVFFYQGKPIEAMGEIDLAKNLNELLIINEDTKSNYSFWKQKISIQQSNSKPSSLLQNVQIWFPDINNGEKIICFFAPGCDNCKVTLKELTELKKQFPEFPEVQIVFMGEEPELIPSFFTYAGANYNYKIADIAAFWQSIGTEKDTPAIFYLFNGSVIKSYNGINQNKFNSQDLKKQINQIGKFKEKTVLHNSMTAPIEFDLELGDNFQGGTVFYLEPNNRHGLIFTRLSDQEYNWADAFSVSNSLVKNGYSDWYLPKLNELQKLLRLMKNNVNEQSSIWSSTENDNDSAFWMSFPDGASSYSLKTNKRNIIAVRRF